MIHRSPFRPLTIPNVSVADLVLEPMASYGSRVALIDAATDRRLTFDQVLDGVRRVASGLARRGFGPGQVFAIFCPNAIEYPIATLAVAKAGGIATTLNPLATTEELTNQLSQSRARFVLTVPGLLEKVLVAAGRAGVEVVFVLGEASGATPFADLYDPDPREVSVELDYAADIVAMPWSSGTSGRPKGVMLTHRNLVAQLLQFTTVQQCPADTALIAVLPYFHIYGLVLIMFASLWRGMTQVVMARFEFEPFLAALAKYRVTLAPIVPPIVVALTKHPAVAQHDLSALRYIMSGAAPLGGDVELACGKRLNCLIAQGYGMTELSGASHLHPFDPTVIHSGSVGFLAPSLEAQIVDPESGRRLDVGERGELWLRGPNVMAGYLNEPEATARTLDADGWLHTGDIAEVDADGYWAIVDRVKELIKYKGHQVAPADLEAVLLSHPSIADAAVIPSPCPDAGEVPKAYVVLRAPLTDEEIIRYVAERVAPAEKVRRVAVVDSIPKSPSGKILRRVLIERERAAVNADPPSST